MVWKYFFSRNFHDFSSLRDPYTKKRKCPGARNVPRHNSPPIQGEFPSWGNGRISGDSRKCPGARNVDDLGVFVSRKTYKKRLTKKDLQKRIGGSDKRHDGKRED